MNTAFGLGKSAPPPSRKMRGVSPITNTLKARLRELSNDEPHFAVMAALAELRGPGDEQQG